MITALRKSFIDPFANPKLAALFVSIATGMFAFSFIGTYLSIDMLRLGFAGIVTYLETWLVLAGFVGFPFLFFISKRYSFRLAQIAIIVMQFVGMALLLMQPSITDQPFWMGFVLFLIATGFWQMNHICLAGHASDDGRGYEIGLAKSIGEVATVFGAGAAGFALAYNVNAVLTAAFVLASIATFGLIYATPAQTDAEDGAQGTISFENLFAVLRRYPRQNLATALEAAFEMHTTILRSTWLAMIGVGASVIGLIGALQALWTTLLVPLIGRFIHNNKGTEFKAATVSSFLSWCVVMTGSLGMWISSFFWAAAVSFFRCGLESRWYQDRSATQILIREVILTIVRIPCIPLFAWIILEYPWYYPAAGVVVAIALWPVGMGVLRQSQK